MMVGLAYVAHFIIAAGTDIPPWAQWGVLGVVLAATFIFKQIVPGYLYEKEVQRGEKLEKIIEAKDVEIARLRQATEDKTLPMLERAMILIERATAQAEQRQEERTGTRARGSR